MALDGEYEPSPWNWVADQVKAYEASDGVDGYLLNGMPCVILTTRGRMTGKVRKSALMRVEHDGAYAVVASMGGAPKHPVWYLNLVADPVVALRDAATIMHRRARTASADEKQAWWPHCVAAYPPYADYQAKTERDIPVVLFDPV